VPELKARRLLPLRKSQRLRFEKPYVCPAGVDEAGRGPLAGPVVAGACVLPKGIIFNKLNDSKKLSFAKREQLFEELHSDPRVHCAVGIVDIATIDRINILQATIQAMIETVSTVTKGMELRSTSLR